MIKFSKTRKVRVFEEIPEHLRKVRRVRMSERIDESTGDIISSDEIELLDITIPQTPQTGVEVFVNDLSFMYKSGKPISENGARLSMFAAGHPFENLRKVESMAEGISSQFSKHGDTNNNVEKN